jgi:hypothetical protein
MLTKIEAEGIEDASSTGDDVFSDVDELSFFEVDTYSIIRALEELPERYSFYLVLRYEYGFDDEGMADLLGTHPANIRSELCRATNALNTRLNDVAVAGAERVENAKDMVCAVLPSFVNNIGAAFLSMECEPVEFSEEFEEVAVYTPPPPKPYESKGIYVSGGSACSKGARSHVLTAQGVSPKRIDCAVRISFSHNNTEEEADRLISALGEALSLV